MIATSDVAAEAARGAARRLASAREARRPGALLPEGCRPGSVEQAIEIQRCVGMLLSDSVGGWKCSLPGPDVVAAPVYASSIHNGSPCPVLTRGGVARVEPEIAFVLGSDLPPRGTAYSETELRAAIAETRLVLELIGSRYAEPAAASFPELVADNLSNQGLYVGSVIEGGPDAVPGAFPIAVEGPDGFLVTCQGRHPAGHPLRAFRWLAQSLAERGETMTKGQIIITGSFAGVLDVPVGGVLRFGFGQLGALTVQFCTAPPARF
jgi:2-keto-4-pentenoate hydratase